jgi:hypothetical protein
MKWLALKPKDIKGAFSHPKTPKIGECLNKFFMSEKKKIEELVLELFTMLA